MISMIVTNTAAFSQFYADLYETIEPGAHLTISRSMAEIDSMNDLKAKVSAGTTTVSLTASSDNVDILSIPVEQHGSSSTVSAASAATSNIAVVFLVAYPLGIVPKVFTTLDVSNGTTAAGYVNITSVTNAGFVARIVVITTGTGTVQANWMAVY